MARRKHISQIRGRNQLRRRPGKRQPKAITLIVCEGETEQEYFDQVRRQLGLGTAEVVIPRDQGGLAPTSVVAYAEGRAKEPGGYDQIFCVFDRDDPVNFTKARTKICALATRSRNQLPIWEVASVPCFEVWILLHFEKTDASFNECDSVIQRVRHHMPRYKKADRECVKQLLPQLETALANARWLETRTGIANENPSTSVPRVIEHLRAVSTSA